MTFWGENAPRHENRLTIDHSKADAWGIPVAHIDCTHSDSDKRRLQQMREAAQELASLAGMELGDPSRRPWRKKLASIFRKESVGVPTGSAIHANGGAP